MKALITAVLTTVLLVGQANAGEKVDLKTKKDKISYSIGLDIGGNLKRQSIDINPEAFAKGISDVLAGREPQMSEKEVQETLAAFQKEMMAKQAKMAEEIGKKNKEEGIAFLEANKKKEGVITTPSGLQYKVVKEGTGEKPAATNTVEVNYRGTLIDGTEFDSSYKRGEPATFPVNRVIPGWTEALQLMKVGSKYQLFIPSNIAYGERGAGGKIGPNATLLFEVELLAIK